MPLAVTNAAPTVADLAERHHVTLAEKLSKCRRARSVKEICKAEVACKGPHEGWGHKREGSRARAHDRQGPQARVISRGHKQGVVRKAARVIGRGVTSRGKGVTTAEGHKQR